VRVTRVVRKVSNYISSILIGSVIVVTYKGD